MQEVSYVSIICIKFSLESEAFTSVKQFVAGCPYWHLYLLSGEIRVVSVMIWRS